MGSDQPNHILYHFLYSICSLQIRYSYAIRGQPKNGADEIVVEEKSVDLLRKEQLTEHFLCNVNAAGEVPVLVPPDSKPIPETVAITKYLARLYPSLIPSSHEHDINRLLLELHDINYFSLSFTGKPFIPQASKEFLEGLLASQISDEYREAIKYKIERLVRQSNSKISITNKRLSLDATKLAALSKEAVKSNEDKARELMKKFETILQQSSTGWCFGLDRPSAIDAHLAVLIARMQDVGRHNLIPESLGKYAATAMGGSEWQEVMQGRTTFGGMKDS